MAKRVGHCSNYDGCEKALKKAIIEADEFNFVCPECGRPLRLPPPPKGPRWLLIGLLALFFVGGIAGLIYALQSGGDSPADQIAVVEPMPSGSDIPHAGLDGPDLGLAKCTPQPLLMDGKRSLYQRVLSRPNAMLVAEPGDNGGTPLDSLQRFYVYERLQSLGKEWLRVGAEADCKTNGWLSADRAVPWKQQITVAFDNPAGRDRVLVFSDIADLKRIANSPNPGPDLEALQDAVRARRYDARIVSVEPENYVDFAQRPYLLPIVDFQETNREGFPLQLLKIHSISKDTALPPIVATTTKAAVVFVIDTTLSMQPYIKNTRDAVRQIFDRLNSSPSGSEIDFGLVVFRSSIKAVPGLEYATKALVRPEQTNNHTVFLDAIGGVEEAHVSSKKFDEDSYAGIDVALDMLQKEGGKTYDSRHIILITDAGPLRSTDELSSRKKSAKDLLEKAKDSPRVRLYAMHLKTAGGIKWNDHPMAEREYKELTKNVETGDSLYYPVDHAGSLGDFTYQINCLPGFISNIVVNLASQGNDSGQIASLCPPVPNNPQLNETLKKMRSHAVILGQALRMEYLGLRPEGKSVPDDFEGWISERDLKEPIRPSVDVRVLLTKRELSNLANGVKAILQAAEVGRTSPDQFYNSLRDFSVKMGRDSARAKPRENISVADMGLLGEYLDDLPYKSQVMGLDQETWAMWSASQQDEFTRSLKNKLDRYAAYDEDNALWWPKTSDVEENDKIYPVPLDALP